MKRREFIGLIGSAAAAWPLVARAQQTGKLPTIGFLGAGAASVWSSWVGAFVEQLHRQGWIEGRTVEIEYRWAEGRSERFAEIAAEFARLKVDVIVTGEPHRSLRSSRRHLSFRLSLQWRRTRLAQVLSPVWRVPTAMLPACLPWDRISRQSVSNLRARRAPASPGWRSWQ